MSRKRWMLGGGLATLALASTLTAGSVFAHDTGTDAQTRAQTYIERLAQNLGLSSDQVKQGLQRTQEQYVDDAVAEGKITADQAADLKARIAAGEAPLMIGPGLKGGRGHGPGPHGMGMAGMHGVDLASVLGMTNQELRDALASGKTLQQIITEQGKTVAQVVDALVAQATTELDQAVTNGRLTQEQANQRLDALRQKLTDAINNNLVGPRKMDGRHMTPGTPSTTTTRVG